MQEGSEKALAERTDLTGHNDDWRNADVVCGGFPCQDISNAGKRAGITGERSSLWKYLCGAIRMVRPKYAIVENVAALLSNGMGTVLGDLAEIGYDAEWNCISASDVGAPHKRSRVWVVSYPDSKPDVRKPRFDDTGAKKQGGEEQIRVETFQNWFRLGLGQACIGWKWDNKPELCRMDDGLPFRLDRIAAIGNSVIPQITEIIGRAIMAAHKRTNV